MCRDGANGSSDPAVQSMDADQLAQIRKAMDLLSLRQKQEAASAAAAEAAAKEKKTYEFWSTQASACLSCERTLTWMLSCLVYCIGVTCRRVMN